jgi:hypothetical protein
MATPPTFQAEYETVFNLATTPKTVTPTTSTDDVLVVVGASEDWDSGASFGAQLDTPTGHSLTYPLQQAVNVGTYCTAYAWTTIETAGGAGWTLQETATVVNGAWWGIDVARFSGSAGVGASNKANVASGAPSLDITTQADNSAIIVLVSDWMAVDGASRTWRTVNGITPTAGNGYELTYAFTSGRYTVYVAYYPDAGTAGLKTVGLSAPTGMKYSIVAVEVKSAAGTNAIVVPPARVDVLIH